MTEPLRTCAACHTPRPRAEVLCVAGPTGAAWYCTDEQACARRRERAHEAPAGRAQAPESGAEVSE